MLSSLRSAIARGGVVLPDCKGVSIANNQANPPASAEYEIGTIGVDPWDTDPYLALRTDPSSVYESALAS
jgi:hypothetical protein